jgi:hypothetical protein
MIKTILICLVAVVVIIIVIGVLFRLFLRADDSDSFDALPGEPRRPSRHPDDTRLPDDTRVREAAVREPVGREPLAAATTARRQRPRPDAADQSWAGDRAPRSPDDRRQPGYRDRGSQDQPQGPDRRNGHDSGPGRPVPAAARAAKPSRPAEAAIPSSKWDKMSDVDYWAELASEKPLTATGAPAESSAATSRRRKPEPVADARPAGRGEPAPHLPVRPRSGRTAATSGPRPTDYGQPPATGPRPAHAPGRYAGGNEPATQSIAALARLGSQPPVPPPAAQPAASQPGRRARPVQPEPLDDDPLTSPSFPAINASDSRSYRTSRPDTQPGRIPPAAAYNEPTQQFNTYQAANDRPASPPNGYPVQSSAPAGNPYGSFVTQPATSYQPAPVGADMVPGYRSQDPGYGQPALGDNGWYSPGGQGAGAAQVPLPAFSPAPPGYLGSDQPAPGQDPASYQAGYQAGQPETVSYPPPGYAGAQYDQRGYGPQEDGYSADGYQGYPGYGTGGY